jgi:hypothetical protein
MNEPDRIDFSALDPARDPDRWDRLVAATRLRVEAALDRLVAAPDPLELMSGWLRPILAGAAVIATLLGAARLLVRDRGSALEGASESRRLAALSDESLGRGLRPTGSQLLVALRSRSAP